MHSGRTRRRRAAIVSGMVVAAVVIGGGGPAPGQVPEEPVDPEVVLVDAYGPSLLGYEDCDGVVHTDGDPVGGIYVELDAAVEADVAVSLSLSGDLVDDLVEAPTEVVVPAGEAFAEAELVFDEQATGELTVTVEPGPGYTADAEDTYTLEISDGPEIVASCTDDLGDPPAGTDRQAILVGERPLPLGFMIQDELGEDETFEQLDGLEALPEGWDTPVANGSLPPGLTYVDDEWGGAATTPGTYAFDVRVCLDRTAVSVETGQQGGLRRPLPWALPDVVCFGQVDVQIAVLAAEAAPPAEPVDADARFTG